MLPSFKLLTKDGLFSSDIDYQYIKCDPKEKQGIFY